MFTFSSNKQKILNVFQSNKLINHICVIAFDEVVLI